VNPWMNLIRTTCVAHGDAFARISKDCELDGRPCNADLPRPRNGSSHVIMSDGISQLCCIEQPSLETNLILLATRLEILLATRLEILD
jgi:hypothetical protein